MIETPHEDLRIIEILNDIRDGKDITKILKRIHEIK
jgi:hypothetical protein